MKNEANTVYVLDLAKTDGGRAYDFSLNPTPKLIHVMHTHTLTHAHYDNVGEDSEKHGSKKKRGQRNET
jgi:hypothetical protein